jgi:hypothetical protein
MKTISKSEAYVIVTLVLLMLLPGIHPAHAQERHVKFGATLKGYYEYDGNQPDDRVVPLRAYDTRGNVFSLQQAAVVADAAPDVPPDAASACGSTCRQCRASACFGSTWPWTIATLRRNGSRPTAPS